MKNQITIQNFASDRVTSQNSTHPELSHTGGNSTM
jgi:hypothetical protein